MFNNPYFNAYNAQPTVDRINSQIAELEKMKTQIPQMQQPTNLTQNFQISPSGTTMRYAGSIEEVGKDIVMGDTPYFSNDMSVLWVKNNKGEIKSYELHEVIQKDEKDLQIEFLQAQIEELKGRINNESSNANVNESSKDEESTDVSDSGKDDEK